MPSRTLVITLGQLRAHRLTWTNFRENVLDELGADLAVCVPDDAFFDFANPFYMHAKFRWIMPDKQELADTFDRIQRLLGSSEDWRVLCDVKGSWLGRIVESNQSGAAAVLFVLRWFMLNNIQAADLAKVYDRFVITRSDFYFICPHPPLDCLDEDSLWIPEGEDYGGLCDRHLVVSAPNLVPSCNLIDDLLVRPKQMREAMLAVSSEWNIERFIAFHLSRNGLIAKVKRFPYVMFLVRGDGDPTAWAPGAYDDGVRMLVKYASELSEAKRYRYLLRSKESWRLYLAAKNFGNVLPARIYTAHGTILYVDESSGQLRHGNESEVASNVLFVPVDAGGRIVHCSGGNRYEISYLADCSRSRLSMTESSDADKLSTSFEQVPIATNRGVTADAPVGLKAGELYLCAEPSGQILLNRRHCHLWEQFRLVPDFIWGSAAPDVRTEPARQRFPRQGTGHCPPTKTWPRLITLQNTVVYVDGASGLLRHGSRETSPANARLVFNGENGEIMHDDEGTLKPVVYSGSRLLSGRENGPGSAMRTLFDLVSLDDGRVALKLNGNFLSAEGPTGQMALSARICSGWENFVLWDPPPDRRGSELGRFARRTPSLGISCILSYGDPGPAVRAVERTMQCIKADCLFWFSNQEFPKTLPGVEVVHIETPSFVDFYDDVARLYLDVMPRAVTTDYNLIVQPDGFAVNPQAWDDRFWEYDYIGAVWPWKWGGGPYWGGPIVGNGGFCWRSRKLYEALLDLRPRWRIEDWTGDERLAFHEFCGTNKVGGKFIPEDYILSIWYRDILEQRYEIKFCPAELANKFSVEAVDPFTQYWMGRSFGFHGRAVAASHYGVEI